VLVGEGHAPVVAVLLASAKPDESIAAPKGHGPPDPAAFPLQTEGFLGATMGAKMAIGGPLWPAPPPRLALPRWWARAMPRCPLLLPLLLLKASCCAKCPDRVNLDDTADFKVVVSLEGLDRSHDPRRHLPARTNVPIEVRPIGLRVDQRP
jgi:hypothetical protein